MDPSSLLTPSEIELLLAFGDQEAVLFGHVTRTLAEGASRSLSLLEHVFLTALAANVEVGNFVIQVPDRRPRISFRSSRRVMIKPNGSYYAWPDPSLEASLSAVVRSFVSEGQAIRLSDLIAAWFGKSAGEHLQAGLRWIFEALAERGLIFRNLEERLNLFKLTKYEIPRKTKSLATEFSQNDPLKRQIEQEGLGEYPADLVLRDLKKELRKLR